jgi:hypothetical protein
VPGREPEREPDLIAQLDEQCRRLMNVLTGHSLRLAAERKLEGVSDAEFAKELGCGERTVERKLRSIRRLWEGLSD